MARTWTDEALREAITSCNNYRDLMISLGISPIGGNYKTVHRHIARLGLSTEHFMTLRDHMQAKGVLGTIGKLTEEAILALFQEGTHCVNSTKKYLSRFKDNSRCEKCGQGRIWNEQPLTLQIDHVNGDRTDNRLENLRYLCPNCHTQTETFGKNHVSRVTAGSTSPKPRAPRRPSAYKTPCKIQWPDDVVLQAMVLAIPTTKVAAQLGVSDAAVGHRCKQRGIRKPGRGYWKTHAPVGELV